ncbi:HAD-IIIA family hydrolase [Bacillus bingmayongensis]|uniref:D,D-heptose 1,7-bisphosphate phosphatase n=1 Tax=Bacillus bingmayongensis TaxID=1150157 RepID=A0ABU5K4W4_9BACI|nr:HAD-IIIA family hydrolase [Bacillus bingmayongensis]MBY0595199.1 HAD-IIIA family hydrolase [Bacillus bingmayongensis]MDZ5610785.1 HAD-IIIA family hydrolase [Bacillus pseudomycoides]
MTNIQAIFIDRDGTIGGDTTVHYPGEFTLFPFTQNSLHALKEQNIKLFSFTNQPGIADGKATVDDFSQELEAFGFDDVYLCPHRHGDGCECRKPSTGMLLQAAKKYNLDLTNCIVIGDRWTDIVAGTSVNATTILVQTGAGYDALHTYRDKWAHIEPSYIATNFEDATKWILER